MSELSSIVQLSISANSRTVTREGFGVALVLTYHTRFAEKFRIYTDLAGMASDGFATTDRAYRKAAALFAQDPAPIQIIVGRLPSAPSFTQTLTMTTSTTGQLVQAKIIAPAAGTITDPAVSGGTISPTGAVLAGTVVSLSYTIPGSSTTTTVATAFEQLVEAVAGVDSTSSGAVITATPTVAGDFPYIYDLVNCTLEETTAAAGYDTELTSLALVNDAWYFINTDSQSPANIAAVAAYALANTKLYAVSTSSSGELAGTGTVGSALKAAANKRTFGLFAFNAHEQAAAAWVGVGAPQDPGSITWAFKELAGVTAKALTSTQKSNLETNNWNHYQPVAGLNVTRQGVTFQGEYIDIVHGIDALQARIQEDVFALLANAKKVPMTELGFDMIANAILGALKAFEGSDQQTGLLKNGSSKVTMPKPSDLSSQDRAARRVTGIKFSADLEGAVHFVSIVGTLST